MISTSKIQETSQKKLWQQALSLFVDTLLPPRCMGTGEIVDMQGMISPTFWKEISFISTPFCDVCGLPFGIDVPQGTHCAACLETPPIFNAARSAVVYNAVSRKLLLGFKYGDRMQAGHTFTPWLMRAGHDILAQSDIIVPVPLHNKRLWQRRFNQSAVLALLLAERSGKTCLPSALRRTKKTTTQKGLSRKDRHDNVKNAFTITPALEQALAGKNILLIDDVMTSGATLNACTKTLLRGGAAKVFCLTVARVTREEFQ